MFGTGQNLHPAHLPTHHGRKAHAGCNLHRWSHRDRLQHRHRGSPNLLLPALCPGMGCDHHDRIVYQSTGPLRGHGRQQHCHRSLHPDHSYSDGSQAENPAAAEDWIGIHVCRWILVSALPPSATLLFEELTMFPQNVHHQHRPSRHAETVIDQPGPNLGGRHAWRVDVSLGPKSSQVHFSPSPSTNTHADFTHQRD